MKVLLVNVPSRAYDRTPPLGLFYVAGILDRQSHQVKIVDIYLKDASLKSFSPSFIDDEINSFMPDIIGFGGIVTSYSRAKILSCHIREKFPGIIQIAGGPLASVSSLLVEKAGIDVVFHGECELSLPAWLQCIENKKPFGEIKGISFLRDGKAVRNQNMEQVKNLDTIPFPPYEKIVSYAPYINESAPARISEVTKTAYNYPEVIRNFSKRIKNNPRYIEFISKRGCTHKCFFCYRHVQGIRSHSVDYVIEHMKLLRSLYNIGGFYFADELFNHNKQWVMELCEKIKKYFPDIFFIVCGARVDMMDSEMLDALKESGCIEISYGQESGADTVLNEYQKAVTVEQNFEVTRLTLEKGIFSPVQLVIGSPSESPETVKQTIKFLKKLKVYTASINYLLPLPETPSWQYAMSHNLIKDIERYLEDVVEFGAGYPYVNLTKYPEKTFSTWVGMIGVKLNALYWKRKRKWTRFFIEDIKFFILWRFPSFYKFLSRLKKFIKRGF